LNSDAAQQTQLAAHGVEGGPELAFDRRVPEPLVRVQAQQWPVVGPFHDLGGGPEGGLDLTGGFVITPLHTRLLDEGVGVAREERQRLGLFVGQSGHRQVASACGQPRDPFGGRHRFPLHARGTEQRIGLATHLEGQRARVGLGVQALAGGRQAHAQVAARDADRSVRTAARHGGEQVVGAARHRDVDRPVVGGRQLGRAGLEGDGRDHQWVAVRVADLDVLADAVHHLFGRQRELQPRGRRLHGDGLHEDRFGLGIEDQRRIPLIGGCGTLEHGLGAEGGARHGFVAGLGRKEIGAGAQLHGLRLGRQGSGQHGHGRHRGPDCPNPLDSPSGPQTRVAGSHRSPLVAQKRPAQALFVKALSNASAFTRSRHASAPR
jgi:hypothetical protein